MDRYGGRQEMCRQGAAGMPLIVLHAGAHRTGTTRLQFLLDDNRDALTGAGVAALTPPRAGKRGAATIRDVVGRLPDTRRSALVSVLRTRPGDGPRRRLERMIAEACAPGIPERLIFSDENLLGPPFDRSGRGLYPFARRRLAAFARLLDRAPAEVHLSLRSYDAFLVSAYAMQAVHGARVPPFGAIRGNLLAPGRGWPELVSDLADLFPASRLVLTRVERHPVRARLGRLVGWQALGIMRIRGDRRPNRAPTVEAMAACGEVRDADRRDRLVARHAGGTRFDPLTEEERAALARRYARDIAALEWPHRSDRRAAPSAANHQQALG